MTSGHVVVFSLSLHTKPLLETWNGLRWRNKQPKIDCHGALKREAPTPNEKRKGTAGV